MTDRATRAAIVEAAFRIANERMLRWEERHADGKSELYLCECADPDCRGKVRLGRPEYEGVREAPTRFLVIPGHQLDDLEEVIEDHEHHLVIEKPGALLDLVTATDPRSPGDGPASEEAEALADELAEEE
jgi:hypothetical protein